MMEMIVVVSVLGILASLTTVMLSDSLQSSRNAKLTSDLQVLNSAVLAYIASNGDLSGADTPAEVIRKLKTVASDSSAATLNGYRGGFLDASIEPVMQTAEEAATDVPRLYWDKDTLKFVFATSGPVGIKSFRTNDALASVTPTMEDRSGVLALAKEDSWIWDYTEAAPTFAPGPTAITAVPEAPTPSLPAAIPAPPPPPAPPSALLAEPIFSTPGSSYPISDFDLIVALSNPNPPGSSDLYYRVDFGSWIPYSAPLSVAPTQTIDAQAITRDPAAYEDSGVANAYYEASPVTLAPPNIVPDQASFGYFTTTDVNVTLTDPNPPGAAVLQYRVEGSPWMDYTTPFVLNESLYPNGATIEARSISAGSPYLLPSSTSLDFVSRDALNLSANTEGVFNTPLGPSTMLTNLSSGQSDSYFEWGDGSSRGNLSESWMQFSGGTFADIVDGVSFNVGSLTYYNGTILSGTGADTVDLDIVLDIDLNGTTFRPFFDFTFELINTPNTTDPIASADFVLLDDARSSRTIVYNGYEFEFALEFGDTTANGFSSFDEFHVIENEQASVNLFGTFNLLGPVDPVGGSTSQDIGGTLVINDSKTGTTSDPLYQKEGYIDPVEATKSVLGLAEDARDAAKSALNAADSAEDDAQKAKVDIVTKISERKYDEAYVLYLLAIESAQLAEQNALIAEARAAEAYGYAVTAKEAASLDPSAESEALKVITAATEARDYADQARFFADDAAQDAAITESSWNSAVAQARDGESADYIAYLAGRASDEEAAAKTARDNASSASDDAINAEADTAKEIGNGRYKEAELAYLLAAPAALEAEAQAALAEEAAVRARALADEAVAVYDDGGLQDRNKAMTSATNAETYASTARAAADAARAAALNAQALWDDALANAGTNDPENWANYLAYLADLERRSAQSARDDAKNGRDEAVKKSAETIKKVNEGKIIEAQTLLALTVTAASLAEEAAVLAEAAAVEARSYAIQAGMIAANDPVAQGAYDNTLVEASDAETYASEARAYANEAAAVLADAEAAMR